jgi:hypothetical protein
MKKFERVIQKSPFIIDSRPQDGVPKWSYFKEMKAFVCKMISNISWSTAAVSPVLPASGTAQNNKSYFIGGVERVQKLAIRIPVEWGTWFCIIYVTSTFRFRQYELSIKIQ